MARIRSIKPEFWGDEKLAPCTPLVRLVFLGLISLADDAGRLVDNVKTLDGMLFPETDDSCREPLEELAYAGRIVRYMSPGGQRIIQIANWAKHQKVDHPNKHVLPGPPREPEPITTRDTRAGVASGSRDPRATISTRDQDQEGEGDPRAGAGARDPEFPTTVEEQQPPPPPQESLRDGNSHPDVDAVLDALVAAGVPAAAREGERTGVLKLLASWPAATLCKAASALPRHRAVAETGKPVGAYLLAWDGMVGECLQLNGGPSAPEADDPEATTLSDPAVSAWLERVTKKARGERDPTLRLELDRMREQSEEVVAAMPGAKRWSTGRRRRRVDLRVAKWYGPKVGDPMPHGPSG